MTEQEKQEFLTIKSREHYINLKNNTHRFLDNIYKRNFAPRNKIGSCSYLYKILKPTSYADFLNKYVNYTNGDNSATLYGRSLETIIEMSKSFQAKAEKEFKDEKNYPSMTFMDYYDLLILHIIIETYDGQRAEEYYRELYENKGFNVSIPDENDDAVMGIDFIIHGPEQTHFIQVKPRTFATSVSSTSRDRQNHFEKEKLIKAKYGENSTLEFIFYEKGAGVDENDIQTYVRDENGRIRFFLSEVCHENGLTKYPRKYEFQNAFQLKKI